FLAGSEGFHPAMAGDRLQLTGSVSFEERESGWNPNRVSLSYSLASRGRGQAVPARRPTHSNEGGERAMLGTFAASDARTHVAATAQLAIINLEDGTSVTLTPGSTLIVPKS